MQVPMMHYHPSRDGKIINMAESNDMAMRHSRKNFVIRMTNGMMYHIVNGDITESEPIPDDGEDLHKKSIKIARRMLNISELNYPPRGKIRGKAKCRCL